MQVHIDTATGAEAIECTKPERSTMRKAAVLFHAIARHGAHLSIMDGPETETALKWIDTIVDHFCSEPAAAPVETDALPPASDDMAAFLVNLADCPSVIEVNDMEMIAAVESWTDEERATIKAACEARRAAIRSTRGDKANAEPAMTG